MPKRWSIFRNFLNDIIDKIDNGNISIDELFHLGNFYDSCQERKEHDDSLDEDAKEVMKIITLGFVANMAMRENSVNN